MASITVTADASGNLSLSDNGNSNCQRNEEVHWVQGSGVSSITSVTAKPSQPANFWQEGPSANGNNFKGKISNSAAGDWNYDITAALTAGGNGSLDPKISVDSK
jgi:hypothetical protein